MPPHDSQLKQAEDTATESGLDKKGSPEFSYCKNHTNKLSVIELKQDNQSMADFYALQSGCPVPQEIPPLP
jgi:hypothetical protein